MGGITSCCSRYATCAIASRKLDVACPNAKLWLPNVSSASTHVYRAGWPVGAVLIGTVRWHTTIKFTVNSNHVIPIAGFVRSGFRGHLRDRNQSINKTVKTVPHLDACATWKSVSEMLKHWYGSTVQLISFASLGGKGITVTFSACKRFLISARADRISYCSASRSVWYFDSSASLVSSWVTGLASVCCALTAAKSATALPTIRTQSWVNSKTCWWAFTFCTGMVLSCVQKTAWSRLMRS